MYYSLSQFDSFLRFYGRTGVDSKGRGVFFNWTCAGFRCRFFGKSLCASLISIPGHVEGVELPWLGISVDGNPTLIKRIELHQGEETYSLFHSEQEQEHELFVWKLSENARGKVFLRALDTDGVLLPLKAQSSVGCFEVLGDSITCAYGIEASRRDNSFQAKEENGYQSYWMQAARIIGAEARAVSVSGISTAVDKNAPTFPGLCGLSELLPYTDRLSDSNANDLWNYATHPCDAVIINLGTNDVNAYKMTTDIAKSKAFFHAQYEALLCTVRQFYGFKTHILCSLGPLDYYLYDEIRDIIAAYCLKTDDTRISCFKYLPVIQWSEGYGAVGHPSQKTHDRMARELVHQLRQLPVWRNEQ